MKRISAILVLLLCLVLLTSCGPETQTVYTVENNGISYTVDTVNGTIFDGKYTYTYMIRGTGSGSQTTITYPNGATYYWSWHGNVGSGGWSDDYDDRMYVKGSTLRDILSMARPRQQEKSGNPLIGLLLIGLGIWNAVSPQTAWYLSHGWRFKDAEPSEMALGLNRIGGVISIVVGVIAMFA